MVQNGRYEVDLDTGVIISFTPFTGDVNATRLAAEDVEKRSSPASRFDKRVPQVNCFSSDINLSDKKVAVDEISDWIGDSHEMQKNYARSYTFVSLSNCDILPCIVDLDTPMPYKRALMYI